MKIDDKRNVVKFFSVDVKELHKYMMMLGLARNKCAHDERFFNIQFRKRLHTKSIKNFKKLGLVQQADGSYISGTNDAYAIAIIFAIILGKQYIKEFTSSMKSAFIKLEKQLHTISIDKVMNVMGFNNNWMKLIYLKN